MKAARVAALVALVATAAGVGGVDARSHLGGRKGGAGQATDPKQDLAAEPRMVIRPSGLVPVFPSGVKCPDVASAYGATTRYDGSRRPMDRFGGLHGGIDITLDEGTPLRALAGGTVISAGSAGMFTGNFLWLQHSPDDTGLPFWVYAKYQHFQDTSAVTIGQTVKAGDVVGLSGRTGTEGRHYGATGYPHLHLTTFAGPSDTWKRRDSSVQSPGAKIFDPMALYVPDLRDVDDVDRLTKDQKKVTIPYAAEDGTVHPAGARLVWPVACKRR
ncbi:MAG: M23 family metallopeptidase [Candidatus Rokubacteria bacterium]|nr:M23 family metallopeptidase [Candidatus Rokubacteria bacterium]